MDMSQGKNYNPMAMVVAHTAAYIDRPIDYHVSHCLRKVRTEYLDSRNSLSGNYVEACILTGTLAMVLNQQSELQSLAVQFFWL